MGPIEPAQLAFFFLLCEIVLPLLAVVVADTMKAAIVPFGDNTIIERLAWIVSELYAHASTDDALLVHVKRRFAIKIGLPQQFGAFGAPCRLANISAS